MDDEKLKDYPSDAKVEDVAPPPLSATLDVGPPPDGGREAWSCAISGAFVTFCLMGFGTSPLCAVA